jgi:hypothetical protein
VRAAWVFPLPPEPGVVQSVPLEVPKATSRVQSEVFAIEPQTSKIRTYWPLSVEVAAPVPVKKPAESA